MRKARDFPRRVVWWIFSSERDVLYVCGIIIKTCGYNSWIPFAFFLRYLLLPRRSVRERKNECVHMRHLALTSRVIRYGNEVRCDA